MGRFEHPLGTVGTVDRRPSASEQLAGWRSPRPQILIPRSSHPFLDLTRNLACSDQNWDVILIDA